MFMIIFDEINVAGFLWKCLKKVSISGQNDRVEQLLIIERYWTLLTEEKSSGEI